MKKQSVFEELSELKVGYLEQNFQNVLRQSNLNYPLIVLGVQLKVFG